MTEQVRRATRLIEIERRLRAHPMGLTVRELAAATGYSTRTIQRDLNALESELGAPLVEAPGRRWRLLPGSTPIGAVRFSLDEARALFLAARVMLRHPGEQDRDTLGALEKLADALPPPLTRQLRAFTGQLQDRSLPSGRQQVLRTLTEAWAGSQTVLIRYRSQQSKTNRTIELDPYLLEPSPNGAATYVIGFSRQHNQVRTFKLERIESAELTHQHFEAHDIPELSQKMQRSWGIVYGDDEYEVIIDFSADVAERVAETTWHSSQRLTPLPDGGVRLELRIPSFLEFVPWLRSWGSAAYVVAPEELRAEIAADFKRAARRYAQPGNGATAPIS